MASLQRRGNHSHLCVGSTSRPPSGSGLVRHQRISAQWFECPSCHRDDHSRRRTKERIASNGGEEQLLRKDFVFSGCSRTSPRVLDQTTLIPAALLLCSPTLPALLRRGVAGISNSPSGSELVLGSPDNSSSTIPTDKTEERTASDAGRSDSQCTASVKNCLS